MQHQDSPVLRCDVCGVEATGIDERGYELCERHAGEWRGECNARRETAGVMLRSAITAARTAGLEEDDIRRAVGAELAGDTVTRIEKDVPRIPPDDPPDPFGFGAKEEGS
jgi:hypothetical protein